MQDRLDRHPAHESDRRLTVGREDPVVVLEREGRARLDRLVVPEDRVRADPALPVVDHRPLDRYVPQHGPCRSVHGSRRSTLLRQLTESLGRHARTYDRSRSVVYHRQGRIGTYAIFWNHEAIQAGATFALEDDDWIFPSYRESAIGLVRGMPVETILHW